MNPITGEAPQVDWPTVTIGQHQLVVRWTFFAQWLLSKRKVDIKSLGPMLANKEAPLVDCMVEIFAAMVAENFTSRELAAPSAEFWALAISKQPAIWPQCTAAIFGAFSKVPAAVAPTPADPATTGTQTNQVN